MTAQPPPEVQAWLDAIDHGPRDSHGDAFSGLIGATQPPVDWTYAIWDRLLVLLTHKDNRTRAIAGQMLSGLAKSDPDRRMRKDLAALVEATKDERFVTARHILFSLAKVGVVDPEIRQDLTARLAERFKACSAEKNATLIRYDILCVLRTVFDETGDAAVKDAAQALIALNTDPAHAKKYGSAWKGA